MPTPSSVKAISNHNYVDSLTAEEMHYPEREENLVRKYGTQDLTGFVRMLGTENPVSSIQYTHNEDDWAHEIVKVSGITAVIDAGSGTGTTTTPAAGDGATYTIATAYRYTYPGSAQAPYVQTGAVTTNPVRVNDVIVFPGATEVKAIVSAVDSTTFTAYPIKSTVALPGSGDAGLADYEIRISGTAHAEGSGQPEGLNSRVNSYTNNLMIHKGTCSVTGTEMAQKTWIKVKGGYLWYLESMFHNRRVYENQFEMLMLEGETITNTALPSAMATTTITEGFIPFVENYGLTESWDASAGFDVADMDNMVNKLDRNKGAKENSLWAGLQLSISLDDTYKGIDNGSNQVSYLLFDGDKEKALNLNFTSFERAGYTFHKQTYSLFNDQKTFGVTGSRYPYYGMVMPSGNTTAADAKGNKETVPSFRINYLSENGYSRLHEEWYNGGANGVFTNDLDRLDFYMRGHKGFQGFGANRFLAIDPTNF